MLVRDVRLVWQATKFWSINSGTLKFWITSRVGSFRGATPRRKFSLEIQVTGSRLVTLSTVTFSADLVLCKPTRSNNVNGFPT